MIRSAVRLLTLALIVLAPFSYADTLEEIIVTAQKREQNTRDVPISVTSTAGRQLDSLFNGGADIRALANRIPGLYVESSNGRVAPRFYIRGLGNIDFDVAASQPVSVVMDDVVMENVILKSFPIFDQDRIEVSRGPQGSLFGRNTTAGVVKLVSRKPTMENDAYISLDVGNLDTVNFEGAISGAIADNVAARVSVLSQNRGEYINNAFTGESGVTGDIQESAVRGQILYQGVDLSVLVNVHARSLDGTASIFRANTLTAGSNELNENFDRDVVFFDAGANNPQEYDANGGSLTIAYNYEGMTLTSITAFESADGYSRGDIDGGYGSSSLPGPMGPGFILFDAESEDRADVEQFTQEFRLANDASAEYGFDWQVGLFYFDADVSAVTNPFFAPPTTVEHSNQAWAIFGQATIPLSDQIDLIGGLRYSDDEKSLVAPGYNIDLADDQVSGDLALNFRLTDNTSIYARYANGFKAPTIQGRDIAFGAPPSTATSETSDAFEIGFKQRLFNGRGELSGAAYAYLVHDLQLTAVGGSGTNTISILNAKRGRGDGIELEGRFLIGDNFELSASYATSETEIRDGPLRVGVCVSCTVLDGQDVNGFAFIDGNPFPNAPEYTLNVTGELFFPMGSGEVFAYIDYAQQGKTNIFLYESAEFFTDDQYELGAQLGYRAASGAWEAYVFGRNITDQENIQGGLDISNNATFVNEPRIMGVTFTSQFF